MSDRCDTTLAPSLHYSLPFHYHLDTEPPTNFYDLHRTYELMMVEDEEDWGGWMDMCLWKLNRLALEGERDSTPPLLLLLPIYHHVHTCSRPNQTLSCLSATNCFHLVHPETHMDNDLGRFDAKFHWTLSLRRERPERPGEMKSSMLRTWTSAWSSSSPVRSVEWGRAPRFVIVHFVILFVVDRLGSNFWG